MDNSGAPATSPLKEWGLVVVSIAALAAVLIAALVSLVQSRGVNPALTIALIVIAEGTLGAAWFRERSARVLNDRRFAGLPRLKVPANGYFGVRRQVDLVVGGVMVPNKKLPLFSLVVAFENDPALPSPESVANQVAASITFLDSADKPLFEIPGLWNEQVTQLIEFPIGTRRSMEIALKYLNEADCYAVCHEAGKDRFVRRDSFKLPPGEYNVDVRLRGVHIDNTWRLRFRNPEGTQPLEPDSCKQIA